MNFKEKIANYVLGNIPTSEFPQIALQALEEGNESDSILILSGMSGSDNGFELVRYFESSIYELNYTLPSKYQAAIVLLKNYLQKIILHPELAFSTMKIIDNEVYKTCDWEVELESPNTEYFGSELGLEKMYTWYRELQDAQVGSKLMYYSELPKNERIKKYNEHLSIEARVLARKIGTK